MNEYIYITMHWSQTYHTTKGTTKKLKYIWIERSRTAHYQANLAAKCITNFVKYQFVPKGVVTNDTSFGKVFLFEMKCRVQQKTFHHITLNTILNFTIDSGQQTWNGYKEWV